MLKVVRDEEKQSKDWKCNIFNIKFGKDGIQYFVQVFDSKRHLKRARHSLSFWYCIGVLWGK